MTSSQRGFATADMRTMRAPLDSLLQHLPWRSPPLATAMRAKFALGITFRLQTSDGSLAAADRQADNASDALPIASHGGIERTNLQIGARLDKRRNSRAG
jgi:hypothetical protein